MADTNLDNQKENALEAEVKTSAESEAETDENGIPDNGLAKGDSPDFKWYVVKTMTGQENKVSKTLKERVINTGLTECFADILVPEEMVVSNVNGKKRRIKKKYFPGYVLVKMIMNDSAWHLVKNTDKITGFIGGTKEKPAPLSDEEASKLTNQVKEGFKKTKSRIDFEEGQSVKVTEGPFASFIGTIESVSDKGKVKVSVSIFGRPTPVELDFSQVEKITE